MHASSHAMTEGPIGKTMIAFAIPIFLGNLFQQLYNAADSLIVGNLLGHNALAAVGSTSSLIFLLIGFFNGVSLGAGVIVAQYYGAKRYEDLETAIHTLISFGLLASVFLTVLGVVLTPHILVWMKTPDNVLAGAVSYLRIYFSGALGLIMYNIFVGILQCVGDSRHPLLYLILSSLTNIVLDIVFIKVFHFGVGSAAAATIISQFFSALLCLHRLLTTREPYRVSVKKLCLHGEMLKKIIRYGVPSGIQFSIVSLANVVVQSNINVFGEMAMAGSGAYQKIEGVGMLSVSSFAQATSTFVGQNIGAEQLDRAKKGARLGLLCAMGLAEISGILIFILAPGFVAMFNSDPQVVAFGVAQCRTIGLFYFLPACSHGFAAIFRGVGKPLVPMAILLTCWCAIRVAFLTIAVPLIGSIQVVYSAYPLTWGLSSLFFLVYWRISRPLDHAVQQ